MYLEIIKINSQEMRNRLASYIGDFETLQLTKPRPPLITRRAAALAMARNILVTNNLLPHSIAQQVEINHKESGEPFLVYIENEISFHISISHSGRWIACLISPTQKRACIDLEDMKIQRNYLKISEHYYSEQEHKFVKKNGQIGFYQLWTAKEAVAKFYGKGLSQALKTQPNIAMINATLANEHYDYQLTQQITDDYIYTICAEPTAHN